MVNTHKWLEKIVNEADIPLMVYVKRNNCDKKDSTELKLEELSKESQRNYPLYVMCYTFHSMPFPEVATNRVYFFLPKNQSPPTGGDSKFIIDNFYNVLENMDRLLEEGGPFDDSDIDFTEPIRQGNQSMLTSGESIFCSPEEAERRFSICKGCSNYVNERCKLCGCDMSVKTKIAPAKCDDTPRKW